MAAAGNYKFASQEAMCETFILSANVVPQEGRNNGDYWFRMELLARKDLAEAFPELFVFSGEAWCVCVRAYVLLGSLTFVAQKKARSSFQKRWTAIPTRA